MKFDPVIAQQKRREMKAKCVATANEAVALVEGKYNKVLKIVYHTSISGLAWMDNKFDKATLKRIDSRPVIKTPRPHSRRALHIFLHECAHHICGHFDHRNPAFGSVEFREARLREEQEADSWAIQFLREHGIAVPRKTLSHVRYNINKQKVALKKARKGPKCPNHPLNKR
jgi:hypothetical protein